MLTREQLHTLIDALPDEELTRAAEAIAEVTDPVLRALLLAPEDDEPLTPEDLAAIAEAQAHSDFITWEEYLAERSRSDLCRGD